MQLWGGEKLRKFKLLTQIEINENKDGVVAKEKETLGSLESFW